MKPFPDVILSACCWFTIGLSTPLKTYLLSLRRLPKSPQGYSSPPERRDATSSSCAERGPDRRRRPVDVSVGGGPVRDGHPQHVTALPGRATQPACAVGLDRRHRAPVRRVVAGQPDQNLVEHHVIEYLGAGDVGQQRGHPAGLRAVAFHEFGYAGPAEGTQRRVHRNG